jgi:hypothetical protein
MAIPLHRLRPTATTLAALVGVTWALSFGAAREFVWADLREGMIDLKGLARSTRALVWTGFTLLGVMLLALVFNDAWRALSPLVPLSSGLSTAGRGAMLPVALIPTTLFLVALAWSFALTGALHARRSIRLGVLGLYLLSASVWVNSNTALAMYLMGAAGLGDLRPMAAGWALLALMPLLFWLRRGRAARPALEFPVILSLVAGALLVAQANHMESWHTMGVPVMVGILEVNLATLQGFVIPLLLLIGVDIAVFTHQASGWAAGIATEGKARRIGVALLLAVLAWRLYEVFGELAGRIAAGTAGDEALQYAGALGIPLLAFAAWWVIARPGAPPAPEEEPATAEGVLGAAERYAPVMILAFIGMQLVGTLFLLLTQSLPMTPVTRAIQAVAMSLSALLNQRLTLPWHLAVYGGALALAFRLARRGRRSLALYLAIFGLIHFWFESITPGRPLAALGWRGAEPEDFWWTVLIAGTALFWLARRQLTPQRVTALLGLVGMTWLLRQTALLDDPYSPFFLGYSGIGFVAFGILWDTLTAGSWANAGTDGLPRVSRVLMYVGYVLLTVTVVNWAVTSHDLATVGQFTGDTAMVGLDRFGKPILYAIIVLTLAALSRATPKEAVHTAG